MPTHFENAEQCDGSKFKLAFIRCRLQMCQLEFRFQNLPFSKSADEKISCFHVKGRPIRHIFHRFQNVSGAAPQGGLRWTHPSHFFEDRFSNSSKFDCKIRL